MTTDRVPRIKPRKDKREVKWHITFYITEGDQVQGVDGVFFIPSKVEVMNWPRLGRAYVKVTGESPRGYRPYPGTANFDLRGSTDYPPCPDWLKALVKEAMS